MIKGEDHMAKRIIRTDDDPILRKTSRPVEEIDERIKTLVQDMIETMYSAEGVGLAAVQVGILKRIAVIDVYDETGVKVLINPEIVETSGEQHEIEGCLSLPGKQGRVKRPMHVTVEATNLEGERVRYSGEDLLARAFCHEIDHLDGILFTDKAEIVEAE